MRVLINHFYCYCSGIFCKCLVIQKVFLSLSAVSCFSCLFGVFGLVFFVLFVVVGFGIFGTVPFFFERKSLFELGIFWRGGLVWVGDFLEGRGCLGSVFFFFKGSSVVVW